MKCGDRSCDSEIMIMPDAIEQSGAGFIPPEDGKPSQTFTTFLPAISYVCKKEACSWKKVVAISDPNYGRYVVGKEAAIKRAQDYIENTPDLGELCR